MDDGDCMDVRQTACKLIKQRHEFLWPTDLTQTRTEFRSFDEFFDNTNLGATPFGHYVEYLDNMLGSYALKRGKLVKEAPLLVAVLYDNLSIQVLVSAYDCLAKSAACTGTGRYIAGHHLSWDSSRSSVPWGTSSPVAGEWISLVGGVS